MRRISYLLTLSTVFTLATSWSARSWSARSGTARAADRPTAATAEQAARVVDFAKFPVVDGAKESRQVDLAGQSYDAQSTVKSAFESLQRKFLEQKWKSVGQPYVSDDSCSATFQQQGFTVSLTVFKRDPQTVSVQILNLGNVDLSKLPVPAGAKPFFQTPASVGLLTEKSVEAARAEARQLLLAAGWESYGSLAGSFDVKQNAVKLSVTVAQAPAQGNKTLLNYSTQLMSIDLPAPPDAEVVQYADTTRGLFTETSLNQDGVVKFYVERLGKLGWKPTTEKTIKLGIYQAMIFRNPAKEMLTLKLIDFEGKTRAMIEYQSAEQVARADKKADELRAKMKSDKDKPQARTPLKAPQGAEVTSSTKQKIEFRIAKGAKKAVVALAETFKQDGWTVEALVAEEMAGEYIFKKGALELGVSYLDTGVLPAEITVRAVRGTELELIK